MRKGGIIILIFLVVALIVAFLFTQNLGNAARKKEQTEQLQENLLKDAKDAADALEEKIKQESELGQ